MSQQTQEAQIQKDNRKDYIRDSFFTVMMFMGAMMGGFGGSIGMTIGNLMIVGGDSADSLFELKDAVKDILESRHQEVRVHFDAKIADTLRAEIAMKNWIDEDLREAIDWATLSEPQKQEQIEYEYIPSNFEVWADMVSRSRLLGTPVGMHLMPGDPNNYIAQRFPRLPQYLGDNVFRSILREVLNFLDQESENIMRDTNGMTEQEALNYITRNAMQYLHSEKADLMDSLSRQDESKPNKIAPKVKIYISVIYLLKFTNKLVNQIHRSISGVKHQYIKFVKDYLELSAPERFTYNIKNIEDMLNSIDYELVSPLTQREFDLLEGDSSAKRIKIKCPEGHEYFTNPSSIKNKMLKGEGLCQKCYHKSRRVYTFESIVQEAGEREDLIIFPKTQEDWDSIGGFPSDRKIKVKCGQCGEERECMAKTYFEYERCPSCFHIDASLSYETVRDRGLNEGFRLKTPKVKFNKIKASYALDGTKTWATEGLEWKCLDCEEIVKITFQSIRDARTGCPSCKMSEHQKHSHKYLEATFDSPFESEKRLGDIDLDEIGVSPSGSLFSPNLVFDGYAIVRIPGCSTPIPVLFEARGYQYWHWPNQYFKGTYEDFLAWQHYRANAEQKNRFAHEHKIVLISIYEEKLWTRAQVRSELIRQFKLQTKAYGYSEDGITLDPPEYNNFIFRRRFLGLI